MQGGCGPLYHFRVGSPDLGVKCACGGTVVVEGVFRGVCVVNRPNLHGGGFGGGQVKVLCC